MHMGIVCSRKVKAGSHDRCHCWSDVSLAVLEPGICGCYRASLRVTEEHDNICSGGHGPGSEILVFVST